MGSMDGYLQALSLVAILILAPMTIHLIVHKEENTVFVFVETEIEDDDDEIEGRDIPQLNRSEVAIELPPSTSKSLVRPRWVSRR